jgi:hypothetical protein
MLLPIGLRQHLYAYHFWHRQSNIAQFVDRQAQIHSGTLRIPMSESIPYVLQGNPSAQQPNGEGVTETISPLGRNIQTTAPNPLVKDAVNAGRIQRAEGSARTKEEFTPLTLSSLLFQIALQHVPDLIGHGQNQIAARLPLAYPQNSSSPVNIVQRQSNHLAAA